MQFRVLGPFSIVDDGGVSIVVGPPKVRLLAAILLSRDGQVTTDLLVENLWPAARAGRSADNLRGYVHHLRRLLGAGRVRRQPGGYELVRHPDELDATTFRGLASEGRRLAADGELVRAQKCLRAALALWRGAALAELTESEVVRAEAIALEELRLDTYECCFDVELSLGQHVEVCGELRNVSSAHPLREVLRSQLMLALARSGRQAEALAIFGETRQLLAEELGIEPGPQLREAHRLVLRGETLPASRTADGANEGRAYSPPVRPEQLPAAPSRIVGRETELATLDKLVEALDDTVPILVVGPAGVGKTALAVRWARSVAHRYPDGNLFVDLHGFGSEGPLATAEALRHMLRALGVPAATIPDNLDERAGLFRSVVSGRRILVLLDDAASSQQLRPLLPGTGATVVVTSRRRLDGLVARDGAAVVSVPPLSPRQSRQLLAAAADLDEAAAPVATIAELCGGLPLAVRIAAARLTVGALSPGELIERLSDEAGRLSALSVEDGDTAVRAALTVSYRSLRPNAARLFRIVGLHAGRTPSAAACAAMAGDPLPAVQRWLATLVEGHLVTRAGPARFSMHDLVRLFARERADAEDPAVEQAAALRRAHSWYLHTAAEAAAATQPHVTRYEYPTARPDHEIPAFATAAAAAGWAEEELPNLTAALTAIMRAGWADAAWQLAHAVTPLFGLRADPRAWITVATVGRTAAAADPAADTTWFFDNTLGIAYAVLGEHSTAELNFQAALAGARAGGVVDAVASAMGNLATLYGETGRAEAAVEALRDVVRISEEHRLTWRTAAARNSLSASLLVLGRYAECAQTAAVALAEATAQGDLRSAAYAHIHLAEASTALRRDGERLPHLQEACRLARQCGARSLEAQVLLSLGDTLARLDRTTEARRHWREALEHFEALSLPEADSVRARLTDGSAP